MFEIKYGSFNTFDSAWKDKSFVIVDNCYDPYTRNLYLKYINDNRVKYLFSQDNDLSYLSDCPDVEFVICSSESNHLSALYNLHKLKGLRLSTDDNSFDFSKLAPSLTFLRTKYENQNKSWLNHTCISELSLEDYATENLNWFSCLKRKNELKLFEIYTSYNKFRSLNGLKELSNLETLILNYCRRLVDTAEISGLNKLKALHYYDNPRAKKFDIGSLTLLEELYLIDFETTKPRTVDSLNFIKSMPNLRTFWSNYNVLDGDLTELLKLEDVDIFQDRKHYNLKSEKLPRRK